jgi:choline kinase
MSPRVDAGYPQRDGRSGLSSTRRCVESPLPILLAAGVGSRLGGRVKALFRVGGRPLLDHCLEILAAAGFRQLLVVTGHASAVLAAHAGQNQYPISVEFAHNARYSELNNFYTLRIACADVDGPVLVLNSDIIFTREVIDAIHDVEGELKLAIEPGRVDQEALKAKVVGDVVEALGKGLDTTAAYGEFIGVSLMSDHVRRLYVEAADEALAAGETTLYYEDIYSRLCRSVQAVAAKVPRESWAEIDCASDVPAAAAVAARRAGNAFAVA